MPEGDSLRNIVRALGPLLEGAAVRRLRTGGTEHPKLIGLPLGPPRARGKHLLLPIGPDAVLHVHHGLSGAWHAYPRGEVWRRPRREAAIHLETERHDLPCFDPMLVELLDARDAERHPMIARLGPDLLDEPLDLDEVLARARRSPRLSVAGLLLDQQVACGIGNIYKNECLYMEALHPWTRPRDLSDAALRAVYALAHRLMRENVRPGLRATTPLRVQKQSRARFWVYGRAGQPCIRCGDRVRRRQQGDEGRDTFWCPRCQPVPAYTAPDWR